MSDDDVSATDTPRSRFIMKKDVVADEPSRCSASIKKDIADASSRAFVAVKQEPTLPQQPASSSSHLDAPSGARLESIPVRPRPEKRKRITEIARLLRPTNRGACYESDRFRQVVLDLNDWLSHARKHMHGHLQSQLLVKISDRVDMLSKELASVGVELVMLEKEGSRSRTKKCAIQNVRKRPAMMEAKNMKPLAIMQGQEETCQVLAIPMDIKPPAYASMTIGNTIHTKAGKARATGKNIITISPRPSVVKGVNYHKIHKCWQVHARKNGKLVSKIFSVRSYCKDGLDFEAASERAFEDAVRFRKEFIARGLCGKQAVRQSGVKGVTWSASHNNWQVSITIRGKKTSKIFTPKNTKTPEDIEEARVAAVKFRRGLEKKHFAFFQSGE